MAETPATALQELLSSLPEGADPFAAIASLLTEQVYPTLSKAFNAQVWASIAFLSLITISLLASLVIRLHRRRFKLVIKDGSLTRLDHKICVPILWTLEAFLNLVLNPLYRHEAQTKSFSASLGRLLLLIHMPLVVSYAMLTGNVVASAPELRRQFSKLRHGSLYFNAGLATLSVGMCASIFPSAFQVGDALGRVSASFTDITHILDQGSLSGDLALLMEIAKPLALLDQAALDNSDATWRGSIICITYIFLFLVGGVLPGWLLIRYVTRKITALEQNLTVNDGHMGSSQPGLSPMTSRTPDIPQVDIRLHDLSARQAAMRNKSTFRPDLPQDRPFAHLIPVTTPILPPHFNDILVDKEQSSANRAIRLKTALRTELRFLGAYALLLCAHGGMIVFIIAQPAGFLNMRQNLEMVLAFPTWNFIVPGIIVSSVFLYDALTKREGDEGDDRPASSRSKHASRTAVIQCSQVVDIAYATEHSEKRQEFETDEEEFGYSKR